MDYSKVDHDSIAWATANAQDLLRSANDRVNSIDAKAAQLAGFSGVIMALAGATFADGPPQKASTFTEIVFYGCFSLAFLLLAFVILWMVLRVVRPTTFVVIDAKEINEYLTDERLLQAEVWALQMRTLRALEPAVKSAQSASAQKANDLKNGTYAFGAGLIAAVIAIAFSSTVGNGGINERLVGSPEFEKRTSRPAEARELEHHCRQHGETSCREEGNNVRPRN